VGVTLPVNPAPHVSHVQLVAWTNPEHPVQLYENSAGRGVGSVKRAVMVGW